MNLEEKIFTNLFMNPFIVLEKREVSQKVYHFKLSGEITFKKIIPGQHLRLLLYPNQPGKLRDRVRTYSIWAHKQVNESSIVDIAICAHTDGPGSKWAKNAEPNQKILVSNPLGKFTLNESLEKHLFIGDITTLAHYYCFLNNLIKVHSAQGIIYGEDEKLLFPNIDGSFPFLFSNISNGHVKSIINLCNRLEIDPNTQIYIGGAGNICILLLEYFIKERGFTRKHLKVKPFWVHGKTGLE
jgi:NADPH-dependent ferric siderophore reductase